MQLFGGERFFTTHDEVGNSPLDDSEYRLASLLTQLAHTHAEAIDGKLTETLRSFLFGPFGQDLAVRNMWRGIETGLAKYSDLARCFDISPDPEVGFFDACCALASACPGYVLTSGTHSR
jgi:hypothetical protein